MTTSNTIANSATWVAIDISKLRNDIFVQEPGKNRSRMSITNERIDHNRFIEYLKTLPPPVHIVFEST
jgi:hypothetical protein